MTIQKKNQLGGASAFQFSQYYVVVGRVRADLENLFSTTYYFKLNQIFFIFSFKTFNLRSPYKICVKTNWTNSLITLYR